MGEEPDQSFRLRFVVKNEHSTELDVVIEPWGDVHSLSPGAEVLGELTAPATGELHVRVAPNRITIYGWTGAVITVDGV